MRKAFKLPAADDEEDISFSEDEDETASQGQIQKPPPTAKINIDEKILSQEEVKRYWS